MRDDSVLFFLVNVSREDYLEEQESKVKRDDGGENIDVLFTQLIYHWRIKIRCHHHY